MKCHTNFWLFKDKKVIQPGKVLIFGKRPEISLRVRTAFWSWQKICSIDAGFSK